MSDTKKKKGVDPAQALVIFIFILIWLFYYYFSWIGLIIGVSILALYYYLTSQFTKNRNKKQLEKKEQKRITFTEKYGEEMEKLISDRELKIGMSKEIVSEILGYSSFKQDKVNKKGIISTCYYEPYGEKDKEKYAKYAVFENNILTEYGDM